MLLNNKKGQSMEMFNDPVAIALAVVGIIIIGAIIYYVITKVLQ